MKRRGKYAKILRGESVSIESSMVAQCSANSVSKYLHHPCVHYYRVAFLFIIIKI